MKDLKEIGKGLLVSIGVNTGEDEESGQSGHESGRLAVQSPHPSTTRNAPPIVNNMSEVAATPGAPAHVYTDAERHKKYYDVFLGLAKSGGGEPYFLFVAAVDAMREFITDENKLVKAAIKSVKTQNGLDVGQLVAATTAILDSIETAKNEETASIEQNDLQMNASTQATLNATIQQIADLEAQLAQASAQKELLEKDLAQRRKDGEQRKTCLESASQQLRSEVNEIVVKIHQCQEG